MKTKTSKQLQWYQSEIHKDQNELKVDKEKFIKSLEGLTKNDILPKKEKKLTIWQKIMRVLLG